MASCQHYQSPAVGVRVVRVDLDSTDESSPSRFLDEDKKKRRAKKERSRVNSLAVAYQTLASTLYPDPVLGKKRITHQQILERAYQVITDQENELQSLRKKQVMTVYHPSTSHYTISSSGEVLIVAEPMPNNMDLNCNESLVPESSDISSLNYDDKTLNTSPPLFSYELMSPTHLLGEPSGFPRNGFLLNSPVNAPTTT